MLLARLIQGFVVGVSAFDPAAVIGWTTLLVIVVLAASHLPARRATKVDLASALTGRH
jgi:hypothetical protein